MLKELLSNTLSHASISWFHNWTGRSLQHDCDCEYLCLLFHASHIFGILFLFLVALGLGHHELPVLLCCQSLMGPPGSLLQDQKAESKGRIKRHGRPKGRTDGHKGQGGRVRRNKEQRRGLLASIESEGWAS